MSEIAMGTWALGGFGWGDINKKIAIKALHKMIDNGANLIDTAIAYNYGESERVVGEAIKGKRDKVFISTKGGVYHQSDTWVVRDGTKENIFRQCDESLKNLGIDFIDIYFVHWPDLNTDFSETFSAMNKLKQKGKIRHIGVSNFTLQQVYEAEKYVEIDVVQPQYSMLYRKEEQFMKWVHDHKIGIMTYGSLSGGLLTGVYREAPKFEGFDLRPLVYDNFVEPKFSKVMELFKTIDKISNARRVPPAQVVINWNIAKAFVDTALIGTRNVEESEQNCGCMDFELTEEEVTMLDKAIESTVGF